MILSIQHVWKFHFFLSKSKDILLGLKLSLKTVGMKTDNEIKLTLP